MKVGIMQPYFFPYIGYWQLMSSVDKYVIYDDVNYIKGGWINRNKILMNGKSKMINLKMKGASPNKLINEVFVAKDEIYNRKLLRTIEYCYKKAPYFSNVFPLVEEIILYNEEVLSTYLENSIRKIAKYLEMNTEIILSSDLNKDNSLKGQDKIIEICRILGATEYYNAKGGINLYSKEIFDYNGIKIRFIETKLFEYFQHINKFEPNLSIIDVLMFNSKEEVKELLSLYHLI
jgi:hypothetical protein